MDKLKISEMEMYTKIFPLIRDHEETVMRLANRDERNKGLFRQHKENGEYGYYNMGNLSMFVERLTRIKSKHVLDIGCGLATLIRAASIVMPDVEFEGIECEEKIIEMSNHSWPMFMKELIALPPRKYPFPTPKFMNFFETTEKFMSKYDTLYFYEPMFHKDMAKKFVEHLDKVTKPGQHILYVRAGCIGDFMEQSGLYEWIEEDTGMVQILKRI